MLTGTFSVYHCNPITLNETTAGEVVQLFIRDLDNQALVLKAGDVARLKEKGNQLFNQVAAGDDGYIEGATAIYRRALKTTDSLIAQLLKKDLNFTENDTSYFLPLSSTAVFYSPTLKYHAKRLERYIKYKSYERVSSTDDYDKLSEEEFNRKALNFSKLILAHFQKNLAEELKNAYPTAASTLLNAIALRYDPHSNYFTEEQNQEFSNQLSAQTESFGFYLDEDDEGQVIISHIEPGGSAWMSNEVNEGDVFVSVKAGSERITSEELGADRIQDKLNNTKENNITLVVKKQNGLIKSVKLLRQKTASAINSVKGYVLSHNRRNIGYISLPSFYTDMEEQTLPGCANDVAKEILKLENDSISGLIIDLRNNGGGSMLEAMNLAGIFIDEGPLFITKEKNKKPQLAKDINRGSIFKKPIVVMINEASASASELFSNIVKDYNLGLVVGQPSFGKGTAQNVLPLDTNLANAKQAGAADFIKLTTGKFYRLNGSTHQGSGVKPDIELPASPGYFIYKENREPYFLEADSVVKKVLYHPNATINLGALKDGSTRRTTAGQNFKRYRQVSDSINAYINTTQKVVLKFKEYKKHKAANDGFLAAFEKAIMATDNAISCRNNSFDRKVEQVDDEAREFNEKIVQAIQKDLFISESFFTLNDLIKQQP